MANIDKPEECIDWQLTTWDGARREAMRRWAALPLEYIVAALEEMQEVTMALSQTSTSEVEQSPPEAASTVHENKQDYGAGTGAGSDNVEPKKNR